MDPEWRSGGVGGRPFPAMAAPGLRAEGLVRVYSVCGLAGQGPYPALLLPTRGCLPSLAGREGG